MILLSRLFLAFLLAFFMFGCGKDQTTQKNSGLMAANQGIVNNLSSLMTAHPELKTSSLKAIKDASQGFGNIEAISNEDENDSLDMDARIHKFSIGTRFHDRHDHEGAPLETNNLDPIVAKEAQELIDQILDQFDFRGHFSASFKITGITLNEAAKMLEEMEEFAKAMYATKGDGEDKKFSTEAANKEMSCEELVNNPFLKVPESVFEKAIADNKEEIKQSLSGCKNLLGNDFLKCTQDFNQMISVINKYATCDVQSLAKLDETMKKEMGSEYHDLQKSVENCLFEKFSGCGYDHKKLNH